MVCIYLFGVGGSGKACLAKELLKSKKVRRSQQIIGVPKYVLEELGVKGRETLKDPTIFYDIQKAIIDKQCKLEKTYCERQVDILSDHCVLDSLVHTHLKISKNDATKLINDDPRIKDSLLRYSESLLVLLHPIPDVVDDGIRINFSDEELEKTYELYREYCHKYKIPFLNLISSKLGDRVKIIQEALDGKLPLETSNLDNYRKKKRNGKLPGKCTTNFSFYLRKPNKIRSISIQTITVTEHESKQNWETWEQDSCNRFIEKYGAEDLVIVSFAKARSIVVQKMLLEGITINGKEYALIGYSKERKCYMLKGSQERADKLIAENGEFDEKSVSIRMARIGLLFTAVRLTSFEVNKDNVIREDDITAPDNKCFTDGCGGIGLGIAKQLFEEVSRQFEEVDYLPSVYQIRYQGYKGVLALDPTLPNEAIKVRPSMEKFKTSVHGRIGVCGFSRPHTFGHLNKQYIMMLSGLGVPDEVFEQKQKQHFDMVEKMKSCLEKAILILQWQNKFDLAQRLMRHRRVDGEPIDDLVLKAIRLTQSKLVSVSHKLRIFIPRSRNIYGVCDPTATLKYGECFLRITEGNIRCPKTVKGQVVVSKNPCYLLGDVRVLTAVDPFEAGNLNHLVDCIVFPVQGKRPHPDEIAGSDLDGDKFFVCWDPELIPPQTKPPHNYPSAKVQPERKVTFEKIVKYIAEQNQSHQLIAQVNKNYLEWANIKGVNSEECQRLGMLFSRMIDSAKSGEKFDSRELMTPSKKDFKAQEKQFVWQVLESSAKNFTEEFAKRVLRNVDEFSASFEVDEEFVLAIITQEMTNISEYGKFEFVWSYLESIAKDSDDISKVEMFLDKFSDHLNYALFSIQEKREAVALGIPADIITNALRKSNLLSKDDLNAFAMNSDPNKWKFYFREDHENFHWTYLLKALTHHDMCLVVISLPDEVSIVLQFLTKQEMGEKQQVIPGIVSGYVYSKRFQYRKKYVLGHEYTMDLTENRLQLYRNEDLRNTFVWLIATEERKRTERLQLCDGVLNSISVDLTRFSRQISNGTRRHPLVNKVPLVAIEVFVDNKTFSVPYFDTFEANDFEPVAETEEIEAEEVDFETEINLSHMSSKDDLNGKESCETEEYLKTLLEITVEKGKPLLFKRYVDDWHKRTAEVPSFVSELLVSLIENIVVMSTPQDLPEEVKEALRETVLGCKFHLPAQLFKVAGHLSRIQLEDLAVALLIRELDSFKLGISSFIDIFSDWKIWWFVKRDIAQELMLNVGRTVTSNQSLKKSTLVTMNRIKYVLHFAQLHFLDFLQETEFVQQRLRSDKADFRICNLKLDTTTIRTRSGVDILSFYRANALTHPRITQGQFVAVTRQADFNKKKNHESCCCFGQVETIRRVPLTIAVKVSGRVPVTIFESLKSGKLPLWRIDLIANITTFTRVMHALKKLIKAETQLLNVLANPAGHSRDYQLFSEKAHLEILDKQSTTASEIEISDYLNEKQREAIHAALGQTITLIQGPPGTGKTTVACEIIKQVHKTKKYKHILVVAESNLAVNNLAKLLRKDLPLDILRLGTEGELDPEVFDITLGGQLKQQEELYARKTSYRDEHIVSQRKPKFVEKILDNTRIFLATCTGAGDPLLNSRTFGFVLVDEAAQTKETTLLCSLAHGVEQLVMIGDPKQLGPVVIEQRNFRQQTLASKDLPDVSSLSETLFHRLCNVIPSTFLDTQNRMHPELMSFPSQTFYDGKLKCGAIPSCYSPVFFRWPDPKKPLCFINVESKEQKCGTSFSNLEELRVVQLALNELLSVPEDKKDLRIDVTEIGILTFYQGQARLLSDKIKPMVEVRTVDGFQGCEKEAIIVSTVRANEHGDLGFLDSTNRLNVLLTRARRGLIIVGNGRTLRKSQLWNKWIDKAPIFDHNLLDEGTSSEHQAADVGKAKKGQARETLPRGKGAYASRERELSSPRGRLDQYTKTQGNQVVPRRRDNHRDGQGGQTAPRGRAKRVAKQTGRPYR